MSAGDQRPCITASVASFATAIATGSSSASAWNFFRNLAFVIRNDVVAVASNLDRKSIFGTGNWNSLLRAGSYTMSLGTILLIVLILLVIGALPSWPYSGSWGYYPAGGIGTILVIVLILVLVGRI